MVDGIITISGLIIVFFPLFYFINYLLKHIKRKTPFDCHLEIVEEKKRKYGVFIAYIERILLGSTVISFGLWMSEVFKKELFLILFVLSVIGYTVIKYLDEKNTK